MKNQSIEYNGEAEYNLKNIEIHSKVQDGKKLTTGERYFFCDGLRHEYILQYSMCHDEFYYRYFLDYFKNDYDMRQLYKWNPLHNDYFNSMVNEWKQIINKQNNSDQILKIVAEETRKELKQYRKSNSPLNLNFNLADYERDVFLINAWSRFRYIVIVRTLELLYTNGEYRISFNGEEIFLNYKSLVHITTRHFGKDLKPYESNKDFFSKHFLYDNLHILLKDIFDVIDNANVLTKGFLTELTFRYKGDLYKIYFGKFPKQQKGVKTEFVIVVTTFFPLSDKRMLNDLEQKFEEKVLSEALSVFTLKHPHDPQPVGKAGQNLLQR